MEKVRKGVSKKLFPTLRPHTFTSFTLDSSWGHKIIAQSRICNDRK